MNDDFRGLIERGDVEGVRTALEADPGLANRAIRWYLNQQNESDPLHFVSDCVGHGWLADGVAAGIAALLIAHGAAIEDTEGRESPLIASASLGAEGVSAVLMDSGADLEATSIFGARALHWAAWMGTSGTVARLVARGAALEPKCTEFGATPLFWAVHGFGPDGPQPKSDQVGAARILIQAGAVIDTANKHGQSALELSRLGASGEMYELLRSRSTPA